jgi:hypothetical protein
VLFISGVQLDMSIISSTFADDFVAELATSHQFKLQAVDHAKLLKIRIEKINKRRARLFEQMGIPLQENKMRPKKIFLSKQSRLVKNMTDKGVDDTGMYFY